MGEPGTPAVGCFVLGGVIPTEPLSFVIPIEPSSLSSRAPPRREAAATHGKNKGSARRGTVEPACR